MGNSQKSLSIMVVMFTMLMTIFTGTLGVEASDKTKTFNSIDRGNFTYSDGRPASLGFVDKKTKKNPKGGYVLGTRVKTDENGDIAYCLNYDLDSPKLGGSEYVKTDEKITPQEYSAIVYGYGGEQDITGKYNVDEDKRYYITQMGLYIVSNDLNSSELTIDSIINHTRGQIDENESKEVYKHIKDFVNYINNNTLDVPTEESIDVSLEGESKEFENKGKYFESGEFTLNNTNKKGKLTVNTDGLGKAYLVNLDGEKVDKEYVEKGNTFKIRLDNKDAEEEGTVGLTVEGEVEYKNVHKYVPKYGPESSKGIGPDGKPLQRMAWIGKGIDTSSDSIELVYENVKRDFEVNKVDEEGNSLDGAKFELYDSEGNKVGKTKTTKEGKVEWKGLRNGEYILKEVEAPKGYVKSEEDIEVNMDGEDKSIQVENKGIKGQLEIIKKDVSTGELIPNAKFKIKDDKGNVVREGTTNEKGIAVFEEIPYGKYTYYEYEAPKGYVLEETEFPFEVKKDGEIIKAEMDNKMIEGSLKITKVDSETGDTLEGVKFELIDEEGNKVKEGTTNEKGILEFKGLKYGKYSFKEVEAKEGYLNNEEEVSFDIEEEGQVVEHEVTNDKIKGDLIITKVDSETGEFLEGAKFQVRDKEGNLVEGVTGKDGKVVFEGLDYGKYEYNEVKAPKGYKIDTTVKNFEIKEEGQEVEVTVENDKNVVKQVTNVFKKEPKKPETKKVNEKEEPEEVVKVEKEQVKEEGKRLPNTATDNYNAVALGILLIVISGGIALYFRKNKGKDEA